MLDASGLLSRQTQCVPWLQLQEVTMASEDPASSWKTGKNWVPKSLSCSLYEALPALLRPMGCRQGDRDQSLERLAPRVREERSRAKNLAKRGSSLLATVLQE